MKIGITIAMPETTRPEYSYKSLADKIKDYIETCQCYPDNDYHWKYLKRLYEKLKSCPRKRVKYKPELIMLHEFLELGNGHTSDDNHVDITGEDTAEFGSVRSK